MLRVCAHCGGEVDPVEVGHRPVETPPEIDGGQGSVVQQVPVFRCFDCGAETPPPA